MFRLCLAALLAYAGYRAGRSFIEGIPDGFEQVPPDARSQRRARAQRGK